MAQSQIGILGGDSKKSYIVHTVNCSSVSTISTKKCKTDVLGLQTFLRDKFAVWASNGSCVEIWNNFKNIVYECIESFVPRKILRKKFGP